MRLTDYYGLTPMYIAPHTTFNAIGGQNYYSQGSLDAISTGHGGHFPTSCRTTGEGTFNPDCLHRNYSWDYYAKTRNKSLSGYKHNRYPLAKMSSYPAYGHPPKVNFSMPSSSTYVDLGRHNSQVYSRECSSQSSIDNLETLNYKELYESIRNENSDLRVKIDELKCKIEEPVKSFENAVSENHRLKSENKALIRVLSALSKND